jgi:hypothetical protein
MLDFKEKIIQYSNKTDEEALQFLFHYWGIEYTGQTFKLIVSGIKESTLLRWILVVPQGFEPWTPCL